MLRLVSGTRGAFKGGGGGKKKRKKVDESKQVWKQVEGNFSKRWHCETFLFFRRIKMATHGPR